MLNQWNLISEIGLHRITDPAVKRNIVLTNRIVTIIFLLNLALFFTNVSRFGLTSFNQFLLFGNVGAFSLILTLNYFGYSILSRLVLSFMLSVYPFISSINSKLGNPYGIEEPMYYMPRMFIMITAIVPLLIFSYKEKLPLAIGVLASFLPLALFDPIHNALGIGYYQMGFSAKIYPTAGVVAIVSYLIFLGATVIFKRINERYEKHNARLITSLRKMNYDMTDKTMQVEEQTRALELAYKEIEIINKNLEKVVNKRTKKLLDQALQFQKFSFKNSHELRGPLTKVMTIIRLIENTDSESEKDGLIQQLNAACIELDLVVHDINDILSETNEELKKDLF